MTSHLRHLAVAVAIAVGSGIAGVESAAAQAPDISGVWTFVVETDAGGGSPTVTIAQEGGRLTGTYVSEQLGTAALTGTIEGAAFTFSFGIALEGMPLTVTLTGTVENAESLRGSYDLGGFSTGTFTATPRRAP
jgi:hypothetical protein